MNRPPNKRAVPWLLLATLVLIYVKSAGIADIPWLVVLAPLLAPFLLVVALVALVGAAAVLAIVMQVLRPKSGAAVVRVSKTRRDTLH